MFSTAMKAPIMEPPTAVHAFSETAGSPAGSLSLMARIDGWFDRHARTQVADERVVRVDDDLHRNSLYDLDEVACGVVGRQHCELLATRRGDAVDDAVPRLSWKCIDVDGDQLTRMHVCKLGLLIIGNDVDGVKRNHGHKLRAGLNVLPDAQGA